MAAERQSIDLVTRREALRRVSALLGGAALLGQGAWLTRSAEAQPAAARALFSAADVALFGEIADTILPTTATPGAKAAGVGPFIAMYVADVYTPEQQRVFKAGLRTLTRKAREAFGKDFVAATATERHGFLEQLDREQFEGAGRRGSRPHYFRQLKELTLLGYFTSEIGCTQALRYAETPGRFEPCVAYQPGEKAWAPHA